MRRLDKVGSLACRAGENKALLQNATYGLSALKAILDAIEGSGFATGTDSLKILSDVLDAIEGSGFSTTTDSLKILSDVLDLIRTELTFEHQADATLTQANPVQNQWYTILDTTLKACLYFIAAHIATTSETIEVRLTIDGNVITRATALTADTWYALYLNATGSLNFDTDLSLMVAARTALIGRSVKVEVRKTTNNGTGTLYGRVSYGKR